MWFLDRLFIYLRVSANYRTEWVSLCKCYFCFLYLFVLYIYFLFLSYLNDFHNLECNQKGVYALLGYDNLCVDKTVQIKKRLSKCS